MERKPLPRENTLLEALGIEITSASAERVEARMPVGPRVHQPFGLLHGGASVALAETVASVGGYMNVDPAREHVVGLEINANHLRAKRDGEVRAVATPLHVGRRTQVWEVKIADEEGKLVCVSRCTIAVVPASREPGAK
jgi:1,4-dihydroxy-2-naphthoyl-CoA hydrolase